MATSATILALGLLLIGLGNRQRNILTPLIVAFGLRVLAAIVNLYVVAFPEHRWGDAPRFENRAWEMASLPWEKFLNALQLGDPYYTYGWIVGLIYRVVGHAVLVPHILNAFLGALVVYYIFKTTRILWNETTAVRAMWVATLFPAFLHYHSILLREVWIALGLILSIYFFSKYLFIKKSLQNALLSLFWMSVSVIFHGGMVAGLIGLLLYLLWRSSKNWYDLLVRGTGTPRRELRSTTLLAVITLPVVLYGFATGANINKIGNIQRLSQSEAFVERIVQVAESRRHGGAAYPAFLSIHDSSDIFTTMIPRIFYFLLSPFPWDIEKIIHAFALIDSFLYLIILYYLIKGISECNIVKIKTLLILLSLLILIFSIGSSNFGTAMRHRAKILPLIICLTPYLPSFKIYN